MNATLTSSWDDGTPEDLEVARLLSSFGYRGTFYATTGPVGRRTIANDALAELVTLGHELGNHGRSHRPFPELSTHELLEEVSWGRREVEAFTRTPCMIAPPRGIVTRQVIRTLRAQGLSVRTAPILGSRWAPEGVLIPTAHIYPHSRFRAFQQLVRRRALPAVPYLKAWSRSRSVRERLRLLVRAAGGTGLILHVWGHSWEIEAQGLWADLAFFLEEAREQGLSPATNGELVGEAAAAHS